MQINQFKIKFNYENILDDFYIYQIKNVKYKEYSRFFNQIKDEIKEALSIIYVDFKVYILSKNKIDPNLTTLDIKRQNIENLGENQEFIIFKLLVYATSTIKDKEVIFDSDGIFYLVKPSKRVYETVLVNIKRGEKDKIIFTLNAKNFIKKDFSPKYVEKRDKYIEKNGILIRVKKGENPKIYFVKQKDIDGYKRSSVDFLQTDWTKRSATKIYTLIRFLRDINKNLKDYLDIKLDELNFENFKLEGTRNKRIIKINDLIKDKLSKQGVVIEDFVKDNRSKKFIDEVKIIIENEYNSILTLEKIKKSKSQFNIFITEEPNIDNDPYNDIKKIPKSTQNILLKNLENSKVILPVLLKELVIKQDIINQRISIPSYQQSKKIIFYYFERNKEENKYEIYKLIIDKKILEFSKLKNRESLFDEDEKGYIEKILFKANENSSNPELIIKNDNGDVNIITKTNYFPIPNIEFITKEYDELQIPFYKSYDELLMLKDDVPNDRKDEYIEFLENIRDKEQINLRVEVKKKKVKNYLATKFNINLDKSLTKTEGKTALDVLMGIKYSKIDNKTAYYVVGIKKLGQSLSRTNVIRKIEAIDGNLLLDDLLFMMDEYFVKNKELTVLPYPIKYLREFIKINEGI